MLSPKELLKKIYGYDTFREGQEEVINSILDKKDCLVIMPTGGGKSVCYQIPALLFNGLTLVISPLISLMKDQVDGLVDMGITATYLNSTVDPRELEKRTRDIIKGEYKLVYVAPERLDTYLMKDIVSRCNISHVAIDEAHCVSQWGHDFRSAYLTINDFISKLSIRPVVSAFTATATPHVKADIIKQIKLKDSKTYQYGYNRENLKLYVLKGVNKRQFVKDYVKKNKDESGIVYCSTRKETELVYHMLLKSGIETAIYHAGLTMRQRKDQQEMFLYEKVNVIVATNAFGMGIDKSNVRYVIHYNMPENIEAYYQEAGRAGRDGEESECILLFNPRDVQIRRYLIEKLENKDTAYITHRFEKLQQMTHYCHITTCNRKYILNYFGEEAAEHCGKCSNCSEDIIKEDVTIDAMKAISCVIRMRERFGVSIISEVLKGSKSKRIRQNRFDALSTYGLMNKYTLNHIKEFINSLVADGYLVQSTDEFPVIGVSELGKAVVKKEAVVIHNRIKEREVIKNHDLFERLRVLRRELASNANLPPYTIFPDKTLKEMSQNMPTELNAMRRINGVGEVKLKKYGETFISVIKTYMDEHGIEIPTKLEFETQQVKATRANSKLKEPKAAKQPSSFISADLFIELGSIEAVAKARGFKVRTIEDHLFDAYEKGYELDIDVFIPEKQALEVLSAIEQVGTDRLRPIKDLCSEEVSYTTIKAVLLKQKTS